MNSDRRHGEFRQTGDTVSSDAVRRHGELDRRHEELRQSTKSKAR